MHDVTFGSIIIVVGFILLVFIPIILIWSLNTLFGLGIAYNFWTWLAALILGGLFTAKISK